MSSDKRFQRLILPEIGNVWTFIIDNVARIVLDAILDSILWSMLCVAYCVYLCMSENLNHNLSKEFHYFFFSDRFLSIHCTWNMNCMNWILVLSMIKWGDASTSTKRETKTSKEKLMDEKLSWSNAAKRNRGIRRREKVRVAKKNCCVSCSLNE